MHTPLTIPAFQARWRGVSHTERAASQSHFTDLCHALGVLTPVEADPTAAADHDAKRRRWLDPPGATPDQLKKLTLTNLYNARPTWLAHAHAALDRAVWAAYGWPPDEDPATGPEETILERLLALNGERASANVS